MKSTRPADLPVISALGRMRSSTRSLRDIAASAVAGGNGLLGRLPAPVLASLTRYLEPVHLTRNHVLFRAYEPLTVVHFPITTVVSFVSRLEAGQTLEVGIVGRDGVVGAASARNTTGMPCDGIVQIPGLALRINGDDLRRESLANESLDRILGRFAQVVTAWSMHLAVCNAFHPVEQRCIRWLLRIDDLIPYDHIPVTHDSIAAMLGVRRPTVTLVLRSMQRAGFLTEGRARIVLRERSRLEAACCECYHAMTSDQRRLIDDNNPNHIG